MVLVPTAGAVGGVARVGLTLTKALQADGVPLKLVYPAEITSNATFQTWVDEATVAVTAASELKPDDRHRSLRDTFALWRFLRRSKPSLVNIHFDGSRPQLKDILAIRAAGAKCVIACHAPTSWMPLRHAIPTKLSCALSVGVIAVSEECRRVLRRAGVPDTKIAVMHAGVPTPSNHPTQSEARKRIGLPADAFVVATVTRLVHAKGVDVLIDAVARLSSESTPAHLLIRGDSGPEADVLVQQASKMLPGRFTLVGLDASIEHVYGSADVFAITSRSEGAPLVVMEAAIRGLPVVATDVGDMRTLVIDGETGFLIGVDDPGQTAERLRRLRDDTSLREHFGRRAKSHADQALSDAAMARNYGAIFDRSATCWRSGR